jgi:hypothetical protein
LKNRFVAALPVQVPSHSVVASCSLTSTRRLTNAGSEAVGCAEIIFMLLRRISTDGEQYCMGATLVTRIRTF